MFGLPTQFQAYRKAIVLAAVAVSAGAAGWTINGWRKDKGLAQVQLAHSRAEVRRTAAVGNDWAKATADALATLKAQRAAIASQRAANAAQMAAMRAAQPTSQEFACRGLPLPETYLETFRK